MLARPCDYGACFARSDTKRCLLATAEPVKILLVWHAVQLQLDHEYDTWLAQSNRKDAAYAC